jgi:hypothetical protein
MPLHFSLFLRPNGPPKHAKNRPLGDSGGHLSRSDSPADPTVAAESKPRLFGRGQAGQGVGALPLESSVSAPLPLLYAALQVGLYLLPRDRIVDW